jgi:hypothetical protein
MLMVLSPAKTLDFSPPSVDVAVSRPEFRQEAAELAQTMRRLSRGDLQSLMDISERLAELNWERFQSLDPTCAQGLQAVLAFAGEVYSGLQARTLDAEALDWLQARLRLLSGLYGVLRPLDCIQPYRLEMGTRLPTSRGANLYDFWGGRISQALNRAADGHADRTLVNLASHEYFGAVDRRALKLPVVACVFKEERGGVLRSLGFSAKAARGLMVRYAVDRRIERAADLKSFDEAGYRYRQDLSSAAEWVFVRPMP